MSAYVGGIVLSIILIIFLFVRNQTRYKETVIRQWQQQLLTTTRISAANIQSFFEKYSENLAVVSADPVVESRSCRQKSPYFDKNYCPLYNLYSVHQNDVDAIILLDSNGNIIVRFPKINDHRNDSGEKCPHNIRIEKKLKPLEVAISDVFLNKMKKPAITISAPVFYEERFTGVVRWMITLERISRRYVDSIHIGGSGSMMIIDNNGVVRARADKTQLGCNIFNRADSCRLSGGTHKERKYGKETGDFIIQLKTKDEGWGSCYGLTSPTYNLVVFTKVNAGDKKWIVLTALPYDEIISPILKNAFKNYITGALISLAIIILSILFYRMMRKKEELEVESKYLTEIAKSAEDLRIEKQKRVTALIDGQEMERGRISRELHDSIGQYLLTMKIKLEEMFTSGKPVLKEQVGEIRDLAERTINETKQISFNLMPVMIEELGLTTSLANLCRVMADTAKLKIDFVTYGVPEHIDSFIQTYLYRIAQEALTNVVKHARAAEVNVQLLGNPDQVNLIVQDNGVGFDAMEIRKLQTNGINNINERVSLLNGTFEITSSANAGTILSVKVPLKGKKVDQK